ncbi:MAG TPA: CBS domain-containing protein [Flavobacteriaceae bacterium]|nr:CBS domain-containing protein [Flavobacteriaceae bacterium]
MDINQILTYEAALDLNATTTEVKERFSLLQVTHLPIVQDTKFLGCISLDDMDSLEHGKTLNDYQYLYNRMAVTANTNWIDALQEFSRHNANMLPVLDSDGIYIGYLELEEFIHLLGRTPFLNEPGAVLVLETAIHNYSSSQISQIIESNNGKIMSLFVTGLTDNNIECTIKLNSNRINEIVQTFRRYGYNILSEHLEDTYVEGLKERSKYLKKFLNI